MELVKEHEHEKNVCQIREAVPQRENKLGASTEERGFIQKPRAGCKQRITSNTNNPVVPKAAAPKALLPHTFLIFALRRISIFFATFLNNKVIVALPARQVFITAQRQEGGAQG